MTKTDKEFLVELTKELYESAEHALLMYGSLLEEATTDLTDENGRITEEYMSICNLQRCLDNIHGVLYHLRWIEGYILSRDHKEKKNVKTSA